MQALGARAVQREAAEQDDARDRVGDLRDAGARQVVVDESLRAEAGEQPLRDALLEVQVHDLLGHHALVLEDDRAHRCLAAPVGELLAAAPRGAQRVERRLPARVGGGAALERRQAPDGRPPPAASGSAPSSSSGSESAWRKRLGVEVDPVARALEQRAAALDLLAQLVLAFARGLKLFGGDLLAPCVEVGCLDLGGQTLGVAVADAAVQAALDVVVDHLRQAPELALDRLGLAHEHLEHPVLGALRQHEVVAADGRRRAAACGRCGRCAARCGRGSTAGRSGRGRRNGPGS